MATGREKAPINSENLAALLGLVDIPLNIILGKPNKANKSIKIKSFGKRIQKKK